MQLRRVSAGTE